MSLAHGIAYEAWADDATILAKCAARHGIPVERLWVAARNKACVIVEEKEDADDEDTDA